MNKIFAREFLVFVVSILLIGIYWVILLVWNYSISNKIDQFNIELGKYRAENKKITSVITTKTNNQIWLYNNLVDRYGFDIASEFNSVEIFFNELVQATTISEKAKNKNEFIWSDRFSRELYLAFESMTFTPESFSNFVERNLISDDERLSSQENIKEQQRVGAEIHNLREKMLSKDAIGLVYSIMLIVLFLLRYFYYALIWSIRNVKSA